jgi:ABC-type sugar transport system ATPase subunit
MTALVQMVGISKRFPGVQALKDAPFDLQPEKSTHSWARTGRANPRS